MAGMLVGSFLFGFVSDTFGRRFCMLICSVLMVGLTLKFILQLEITLLTLSD